jgi:carbohydrate-binding DOMON domain-containing protein
LTKKAKKGYDYTNEQKGVKMGDRSHIVIRGNDPKETITLYGHWAGTTNIDAVRSVMGRTTRANDISYLTAELFYEFAIVEGSYKGVGFGSYGMWAGDDDGAWADNPSVYVNTIDGTFDYEGETEEGEEEEENVMLDQDIIHH